MPSHDDDSTLNNGPPTLSLGDRAATDPHPADSGQLPPGPPGDDHAPDVLPFRRSARPTVEPGMPHSIGRPCSAAKREANRANALKSTGPRTAAGKSRSRYNALKHGLRAETIVLPGEDSAEFEARVDAWMADLNPTGVVAQFLVEDAVVASWRLERCRSVETGVLGKSMRDAAGRLDHNEAERVEKLASELDADPVRISRRLRQSAAGCRWVLDRLDALRQALHGRGWIEPSERDRLLHLMGKTTSDVFSDPIAYDVCEAWIGSGAITGGDPSTVQTLLGIPDPIRAVDQWELQRRLEELSVLGADMSSADARDALDDVIVHEIDRLEERWERLAACDEDDRVDVTARAACDVSKDGITRMRYEESFRRALRNALRDIDHRRVQAERAARAEADDEAPGPRRPRRRAAGSITVARSPEPLPAPNEPNPLTRLVDPLDAAPAPPVAIPPPPSSVSPDEPPAVVIESPAPVVPAAPCQADPVPAGGLLLVDPPDPAANPSPRPTSPAPTPHAAPNEANAARGKGRRRRRGRLTPKAPRTGDTVVYRGRLQPAAPDLRTGDRDRDRDREPTPNLPGGAITAVHDFESFCKLLDDKGLEVPDPSIKVYAGGTPPPANPPPR